MVLSSQDNLAIVAATYNAIETAPLKVLRQILLEACESSPIVQQIVSKRLLLRWKEVKELGYEINQHGVFPLTPETTIERFPLYESDEQDEDEGEGCLSTMQRYEACRACKKKFDVCHNLPGSNDACMTHQDGHAVIGPSPAWVVFLRDHTIQILNTQGGLSHGLRLPGLAS
ncbi:hypothetical protein K491DRAFT_729256 [Lophiostoma macrostomum CBS 122681]|uniref:Uncharacterized protein n=1 Tax=Lophiostoma macrostomum CBS 122681 TaxID=1314788 RepID=A0A6A6SUR8_9PLEO|nr:hypothetical protein K491DRAFT_729256 [Lophiostoma macrostomum CBS 122681]